MTFDLRRAKRQLKWLTLANIVAWAVTLILFVLPAYQWWHLGHIPIDATFAVLTAANLILLVAAAKISARLRFSKYQIRYFTNHEST